MDGNSTMFRSTCLDWDIRVDTIVPYMQAWYRLLDHVCADVFLLGSPGKKHQHLFVLCKRVHETYVHVEYDAHTLACQTHIIG